MFIFWVLVFASITGILGLIGLSGVSPRLAALTRVLAGLFAALTLAFIFWSAMLDFQVPTFMRL